jgi:hypothetical protein
MSGVDLDQVSRTLARLLAQENTPILLIDALTGQMIEVRPDSAAAPNGLLPALLVAGEAVWREIAGTGFELTIRRDPVALLGYRVEAIGSGGFSIVLLAMLEAKAQATRAEGFVVNELTAIWRGLGDRIGPAQAETAAAR